MTGRIVGFVAEGKLVFWGNCEYARDGWVGIRQLDGRLDEAPVSHVHVLRPDGNSWTWEQETEQETEHEATNLSLPRMTINLACEYIQAILSPAGGLSDSERATAIRNILVALPDRYSRIAVLDRCPAAHHYL